MKKSRSILNVYRLCIRTKRCVVRDSETVVHQRPKDRIMNNNWLPYTTFNNEEQPYCKVCYIHTMKNIKYEKNSLQSSTCTRI